MIPNKYHKIKKPKAYIKEPTVEELKAIYLDLISIRDYSYRAGLLDRTEFSDLIKLTQLIKEIEIKITFELHKQQTRLDL
jgi:hypothetical protein